jgi:hypothetical protein
MKSKRTASVDKFGRPGIILDEEDVIRLLRAAIERDGKPLGRGDIALIALT